MARRICPSRGASTRSPRWHTRRRSGQAGSARSQSQGEWSEAVTRSLITLKALTYAPTGGIVAAATTSLPEQLGGVRNWDYRFCWLRDATLTLLALMNAGYYSEAAAWRDWLLRAAAGAPSQLQIMYGLAGERRLTEYEVDWLPGYADSRPVRIGNAAHGQLQLDVFGEVMDALHQARRGGLELREEDWAFQRAMLEHLARALAPAGRGHLGGPWRPATLHALQGDGLGRLRPRDQGDEQFGLDGPVDAWRATAPGDPRRRLRSRLQSNAGQLRAVLRLRRARCESAAPADRRVPAAARRPRSEGTIAAVERRLFVDGFLLRYDTHGSEDGLPAGEGAFLACSFWLADAYVLMGRLDDARRLFERLLALRNDVGLLSEEYDTESAASGRQFSAGVLARGARQYRAQPVPGHETGGATLGLVIRSCVHGQRRGRRDTVRVTCPDVAWIRGGPRVRPTRVSTACHTHSPAPGGRPHRYTGDRQGCGRPCAAGFGMVGPPSSRPLRPRGSSWRAIVSIPLTSDQVPEPPCLVASLPRAMTASRGGCDADICAAATGRLGCRGPGTV